MRGRDDQTYGRTCSQPSPYVTADIAGESAPSLLGGTMADLSQYSIVTYERKPGHWRAAITPYRQSGNFIKGKTTFSFVTPYDSTSEPDAKFAAEKIIRNI
jgi:hypothetical protein